ncbi:MAG: phospho-N-acetylmuramoyl-pentapeptide-transferase [Lachnospiraceae bacterium]
MDSNVMIALLITFVLAGLWGKVVIPFMRRLKMKQTERLDGVQSHLKKTGTPTMGGVIFLLPVLLVSLFFVKGYPQILPILILTVGFGLIGFLDDYLKVILKSSDGLKAWQKMGLQILVTTIFAYYLYNYTTVLTQMRIPFMNGQMLEVGWWGIPLLYIAVLGTVNGVNFTDGLDGLATSVTLVVSVFLVIASTLLQAAVGPVLGAVMGGLLAFLLYNAYPAQIFMGDTGSLALGGFVIAAVYMLQMPLIIILAGFIYLLEVVSVMLQVGCFKLTHGKRIFKMAPIHHHFELCGWSETKVVAVFSVITAVLCAVSLLAL